MPLFGRNKQDTSNLNNWGIDDFIHYMDSSKLGGDSKLFQEVRMALAAVKLAEGKQVTEKSAMEMVAANDRLVKACDAYVEKRTKARSEQGKERLEVLRQLSVFQKDKDLDQMRDLREVRKHQGKTWEQVGKTPVAEIHLEKMTDKVGDQASVRYKVEYNGKTGFFTENTFASTNDKIVQQFIEKQEDPSMRELLEKNAAWIQARMEDEKPDMDWMKNDLLSRSSRLRQNNPDKETLEKIEAMEALAASPKALHLCKTAAEEGKRIDTAQFVGRFERDGRSITNRNIATSRMAGLLGLDSIAAHSEKMVAYVNGKRLEGCFMEFAEGTDITSGKEQDQKKWEQVKVTTNASFNRAQSNLEVFDFICGQMDRHYKNMFYKLGEPGEDGMREIVGLQGIDNDLSFGLGNREGRYGHGVKTQNMYFIDKELAQKVRGLDRKSLEYALGDLLTKDEIDAVEERVQEVRENLDKRMVELSENQWRLDGTDFTPANDKEAENYRKGVEDLQADFKNGGILPINIHREANSVFGVKKANENFMQEKAEEAHILEGVQDLFNEAEGKEAQRKSVEQVREELEAQKEADRAARAREYAKAQEAKKAAPQTKEKVSFQDLSARERGSKVRLGEYRAHQRERQASERVRQPQREQGAMRAGK